MRMSDLSGAREAAREAELITMRLQRGWNLIPSSDRILQRTFRELDEDENGNGNGNENKKKEPKAKTLEEELARLYPKAREEEDGNVAVITYADGGVEIVR